MCTQTSLYSLLFSLDTPNNVPSAAYARIHRLIREALLIAHTKSHVAAQFGCYSHFGCVGVWGGGVFGPGFVL